MLKITPATKLSIKSVTIYTTGGKPSAPPTHSRHAYPALTKFLEQGEVIALPPLPPPRVLALPPTRRDLRQRVRYILNKALLPHFEANFRTSAEYHHYPHDCASDESVYLDAMTWMMNEYLQTGELPSESRSADIAWFVMEQQMMADKMVKAGKGVVKRRMLQIGSRVQPRERLEERLEGPEKRMMEGEALRSGGAESAEQEAGGETSAVEERPKKGRSRRKRKSGRKNIPQPAKASEDSGAEVVKTAEQEVRGETPVLEERPGQEGRSCRKRKSGRKGVPQTAKANDDPGAGIVEYAGDGELQITQAYAQEFLKSVVEFEQKQVRPR